MAESILCPVLCSCSPVLSIVEPSEHFWVGESLSAPELWDFGALPHERCSRSLSTFAALHWTLQKLHVSLALESPELGTALWVWKCRCRALPCVIVFHHAEHPCSSSAVVWTRVWTFGFKKVWVFCCMKFIWSWPNASWWDLVWVSLTVFRKAMNHVFK